MLKEAVKVGAIIGMSSALLYHFWAIWHYGKVLIQEPNVPILLSEIVMMCLLLVFGIGLFIELAHKAGKH